MTSESKILTVSYGTFSCTLEGFDNPFDTMKAIAEYFRDLAAQDRHFGAEPPPPDAAMLHRLAEREVSRLATAKSEDSAFLNMPAGPAAEAAIAPRIQINPTGRRPAHAPAPSVEDEPQAAAQPAQVEPSLQDVIPDGVAAKLARIRNAVHPISAEAAALRSAFVAEGPAENLAAAPVEEVAEADAIDAEASAVEAAVAANDADVASQEVASRLGALISDGLPATADYEVEDALEVSGADAWADVAAPIAEVDDFDATALVDAEAELATELSDPELAAFTAGSLNEDDLSSEDVAMLAQLDGTVFDEAALAAELDDTLPEDRPSELSLADAAVIDPLPELADVDATSEALPEEVEAADDLSAEAAEPADLVAEAVSAESAPEAAQEPPAETRAEAFDPMSDDFAQPTGKAGSRTRRVNSRVVRIHPSEDAPGSKRDSGATRVLGSDSDEISRLMQQAEEVMAEDENRRRQEALSRLKAAVVATEADRADIDYEAPRAEANLDPYRGDLAEAIQPDAPPQPQPDPEVKPRRKSVTIRPAEPRPGTIRPGMISPPPLVLVSEQRIDRVAPAAAAPAPTATPAPAPVAAPAISPAAPAARSPESQPMVALRTGRLSGAIGSGAAAASAGMPARNLVLEKPSYGTAAEPEEDEDLAEDSKDIDESGLATFAELVGARSMAEMLEAAAAYATCVEKRTQFTRPQLMRRMMASAGGKSVSREDGLRSFGTLLRTGRIEKVTRGHYSLAENSPYLAEARRLH